MSQKTHHSVWVFYSSHYTHGNSLRVFLLIIVLILNLICFYAYTCSYSSLGCRTPTHHFSGYFTGKSELTGCCLDSQSPVILNILTGQAKCLHIHMVLWAENCCHLASAHASASSVWYSGYHSIFSRTARMQLYLQFVVYSTFFHACYYTIHVLGTTWLIWITSLATKTWLTHAGSPTSV